MPDKNQQIKKLVELNDELENYFRNTIIPQLFIDANLILQKFTPPAMKQFSLQTTDVGRPIEEIRDNFRYPTIIDNIHEVIQTNEILEKEIQTTDFRWYQMNIIPYVTIKEKKSNGVIITFVEITERIKHLREQEKLINDHETLLDIISHDIKGPITSLLLAVELFKNATPDKAKDYPSLLKIVENAIRKMEKVINDLTETRKGEYEKNSKDEVTHFEDILEEVRLTINDKISASGAIIKNDLQVKEIYFPARNLRSIIYNLVSNAIKFKSPERIPEILITTSLENDNIIVSVKDNGKGIAPDKIDAVFDKYFRVENSIEGTGVGLYLVKEIVQNTGGKITLESSPGKGSEFKVFLKQSP